MQIVMCAVADSFRVPLKKGLLALTLAGLAFVASAVLAPGRSYASDWEYYCRAPVPASTRCEALNSWGDNLWVGNYTWQTAYIADTWRPGCRIGDTKAQDMVWITSDYGYRGTPVHVRFGCYAASWSDPNETRWLWPYAYHTHTGYTHFLVGKVGPCSLECELANPAVDTEEEPGAIASGSTACTISPGYGWREKYIRNIRHLHDKHGHQLVRIEMDTRWCYDGVHVTRIRAAIRECSKDSPWGDIGLWECYDTPDTRSGTYCFGSDGYHSKTCVQIHEWNARKDIPLAPVLGDLYVYRHPCAWTRVRGDGSHVREGTCSIPSS